MKKSSTFAQRIVAVYNGIMNLFVIFAGILLSFAALSVAAGIATRYFFSYPLPWVTEIAEFSLLYLPFLLGAWVLKKDSHVKMDIIINLFPPKVQKVVNTITSIICALICLVLAVFAAKVTYDQYLSKAFTYTILEIPKWILTIIIFLGSLMLIIEFSRKAYGYIKLVNLPEGQNHLAPSPKH
ncbi:MAG: TRAP transporter small permease [Desulfatiglandaceae bacterium]|jgi:TRAP-type C4-dicarboxylate transport system permease small subunit